MVNNIKEFIGDVDFRELQEGTIIQLVEGAQPVVFETIEMNRAHLVLLGPIRGLCRREYPLGMDGRLIPSVYTGRKMDQRSREGQKYLAMITGGNS